MLYSELQALMRGEGLDMSRAFAQILASLLIIFLMLPLHELAHGWVAKKLGDPTAQRAGRLTFNPLASVDLFGTLSLLLFGFGWAKPVPIDPRYFKNPKKGMALTALAGPGANLLASFVSALLFNSLAVTTGSGYENPLVLFWLYFLQFSVTINISLAAFNLLPIPPLDGSRIVAMFLSDQTLEMYYRYENIIIWVLFALLLVGVLDVPLYFLQQVFTTWIERLASLPFYLFGA